MIHICRRPTCNKMLRWLLPAGKSVFTRQYSRAMTPAFGTRFFAATNLCFREQRLRTHAAETAPGYA